jgi:hypothetical protein
MMLRNKPSFETIEDVAKRRSVLEVACRRCVRQDRLYVPSLLFEHGPDLPVSDVLGIAAGDCPLMSADHSRHLCGIFLRGVTE